MRRLVVVALCLLLAVACQEMPAEVDEESFVEWVEDTAAVLDGDDWPQAATDDLAVLERCAGAQVVMLGEPDHRPAIRPIWIRLPSTGTAATPDPIATTLRGRLLL